MPFSRNGATNGDCSNVRTSLTKYLYHLYHFTEEKIGFDYYIKYKYISSNFRNFCSHRYNPRETCPCIRESRGGERKGVPIMNGSMNRPGRRYSDVYRAKTVVLSVKDGLTLPLHSIEGQTGSKGEIWPIEISTRSEHRETRAAIMRDTYFLPLM